MNAQLLAFIEFLTYLIFFLGVVTLCGKAFKTKDQDELEEKPKDVPEKHSPIAMLLKHQDKQSDLETKVKGATVIKQFEAPQPVLPVKEFVPLQKQILWSLFDGPTVFSQKRINLLPELAPAKIKIKRKNVLLHRGNSIQKLLQPIL